MLHYYQAGFANPYHERSSPSPSLSVGRKKLTVSCGRKVRAAPKSRRDRPPYRYAWTDTEKAFESIAEAPGDPFDGVCLRYADPLSGGATLPTMNCEVQMFRPGEKGRSHRHTYSVVYHAFRGAGTTWIGDEKFEWQQGDSFVLPLWSWHAHENSSRDAGHFVFHQ